MDDLCASNDFYYVILYVLKCITLRLLNDVLKTFFKLKRFYTRIGIIFASEIIVFIKIIIIK